MSPSAPTVRCFSISRPTRRPPPPPTQMALKMMRSANKASVSAARSSVVAQAQKKTVGSESRRQAEVAACEWPIAIV